MGEAGGPVRYYVYMLGCEDGSIYTGICTDVCRRLREHLSQGRLAARYTRTHKVTSLEGAWEAEGRSCAGKLEWRIHPMSRAEKLRLLEGGGIAGEGYRELPRALCQSLWERAAEVVDAR